MTDVRGFVLPSMTVPESLFPVRRIVPSLS
jgi:hypothetical protein